MTKYFGKIGFIEEVETKPGVWEAVPYERSYKGEVLSFTRRWERDSNSINDDLTISNEISIVSDSYLYQHVSAIRYIKWLGSAWKVTSIRVNRPRLTLSIGGVYNGVTVETSRDSKESM